MEKYQGMKQEGSKGCWRMEREEEGSDGRLMVERRGVKMTSNKRRRGRQKER